MGRHKSKARRDAERLERKERDMQMCYRYAQVRNLRAVAREFKTYPEKVRRAWENLTEEQKNEMLGVDREVMDTLTEKLRYAEEAAGDTFIQDVMYARIMAGKELRRRFQQENIQFIADRDLATLLKVATTILETRAESESPKPENNNVLRTLRETVDEDIDKQIFNN